MALLCDLAVFGALILGRLLLVAFFSGFGIVPALNVRSSFGTTRSTPGEISTVRAVKLVVEQVLLAAIANFVEAGRQRWIHLNRSSIYITQDHNPPVLAMLVVPPI